MSFIHYSAGRYVFEDISENRMSFSSADFLITWHIHGYLRNPGTRKPLTERELSTLINLADRYERPFAQELRSRTNYHCDLYSRREQLSLRTEEEVRDYQELFIYLLTIGLLAIGWDDRSPDFPTVPQSTIDPVGVHLRALPYLRSIIQSPHLPTFRKIGIIGKYCASDYTIESVLREMDDTELEELSLHGQYLILTAHYYLEKYLNYPLPALEPLLNNIAERY